MTIRNSSLFKISYAAINAAPKPLKTVLRYIFWVLQRTQFIRLMVPKLAVKGDFRSILIGRKTILIVSHEGSRTGAPILTYNFVSILLKKYNVVVLFLDSGPLLDSCHTLGAIVAGPMKVGRSVWFSRLAIKQITDVVRVEFALINSIESRFVIPALAEQHIPTISLIHEFAAYTRPYGAFRDTVLWSSQVVFSTTLTRDNMVSVFPDLGQRNYPVIPQGRCLLPSHMHHSDPQTTVDMHGTHQAMRPECFPDDGVVILGIGFVQFRKGVDLFIECAARILHKAPNLPCRFVWVGKGYNPKKDVQYSAYLADQVLRAGLAERFHFIDEVANLDPVYAAADVLLLSSRLDPLPNVAIDAIATGLPVVCFNKATGIADILSEHGLGDTCVASYLNTEEMACKVLALALSRELRDTVAVKSKYIAEQVFNMGIYVSQIEQLALREVERVKQEKLDIETIDKSDQIQFDFYHAPHWQHQSRDEAIRGYVRTWMSSAGRRKLIPGFHPGIYLEQHGLDHMGVDPLADYLRNGRPRGSWNFKLISSQDTPKPLPPKLRIGLHIHAYYPDIFPEIIQRLKRNRIRPDLLVSVTSEPARQEIAAYLATYEGRIEVRIVPNRGRDIGPFLTEFRNIIQNNYDLIGHLHTKRTADFQDISVGQYWYIFLLENLLGGKAPMADMIIGRMADDQDVSIAFPDEPNIVGWGANLSHAKKLFSRLGIERNFNQIVFPVGTMFWARTNALRPIFDLNLNWEDYPNEPLPYDGTMLHAIERLFGVLFMHSPPSILLTNVHGVSR